MFGKPGGLKSRLLSPIKKSTVQKLIPYGIVVLILLVIFIGGIIGWEETNSTVFCGTACHTMPPEYVTQQLSSHANITCDECHLGRAPFFQAIIRKAQYTWQTGSAMVLNTYKYPIVARTMRPASDACIPCHNPTQFVGDTLLTNVEYAPDEKNTATTNYIILRTGGGTSQEGLGKGIHWHIENPVYYYSTDPEQQQIPLVRVVLADGTTQDYVDTETSLDPKTIDNSRMQRMDCISCHNRAAHSIVEPEDAVNDLISRGLVSPIIPYIDEKAVKVLGASYTSMDEANLAITGIATFYQQYYPGFYARNNVVISNSIEAIRSYYQESKFFDQKVDWTTHPNNIGHDDSPGCFRCHDGKHVMSTGEVIRLECNLCHSIPVVSGASALVTDIQVGKGIEPASHTNSNWISLHNQAIDTTCGTCHTVADAGGTSNTSFCSNSECHGQPWTYAGFNAPNLREILKQQLPQVLNPTPTPVPTLPADQPTVEPGSPASGMLTYTDVAPLFAKCTACHTPGGAEGLDLTSYQGIVAGSTDGKVITPGDPTNSMLVQVQSGSHFAQFTSTELAAIIRWIQDGALEK